ncbi:MAG: HU family DNA-binding protein [Desulfobacterales bacterium]|nr:HU family DNA-binding protein [Desulfobacterales bacterium]MBF0396596.1 HU family DNA-binding protein [Desulfobacterales bacterium]
MNKEQLVNFISEKAQLTKADSTKALNALIEGISSSLEKGETVTLIGFGSLKVVERKAKKGRNPQTGKEIDIPASKAVKFSIGKVLKDKVRGKK